MRLVSGLVAAVFSSQLSAQHSRVCRSSNKTQSTDLSSLAEVELLELLERVAAVGLVVMVAAAVTIGQFEGYLPNLQCSVPRIAAHQECLPLTDFHPDCTNWNIVQNTQPKQQIHRQMFVV